MEEQKQEELEITGPGGLRAAFKGSNTFAVLLLLLLAAFFWWVAQNGEAKAEERNKQVQAALIKVETAMTQNEETTRAMIYVLSLKPEDREKLNLSKPRLLQEMQR